MTVAHCPRSVYAACLRGLKMWDRARAGGVLDHGATDQAITFAEMMADNIPIDPTGAAQVVEAHRLLDAAPRHPDGESQAQKLSRLLWGGDDALEWAASVLDAARRRHLVERTPPPPPPTRPPPAVPDSVAATTQDDNLLDALSVELFNIDSTAVAGLEAAFWVAYRTALRSATASARARTNRVSKSVQASAGLGDTELNDARSRLKAAHPYDGWNAVGDRVLAAIDADLDQAVQAALDDYEQTSVGLLEGAVAAGVATIARVLDVPRAVIAELSPAADSIRQAASELRAQLLEWVRLRLDGDRDPDELGDLTVPEGIFAEAVSAAGGTAPDDLEQSVTAPILEAALVAGVASAASGDTNAAAAGGAVGGVIALAAVPRIRRRYEWVYGDPSTREHGPYEDHLALRGRTWSTEEERRSAIGSARPNVPHQSCKCRIRKTWSLS